MENMEELSFKMISAVGTARSNYIQAIRQGKKGDFAAAAASMEAGDKAFQQGHDVHLSIIKEMAENEEKIDILLLHAEDQLMSAENFKIIAAEFIDLYKTVLEKG